MAKKKSPTPNGILKVVNGELVILAPDGKTTFSLEQIANDGIDGGNTKLTLVVELNRKELRTSRKPTVLLELLDVVSELQTFLKQRALGALDACATCGCVQGKSSAKKLKSPKPGNP